MVAFIAEPKDDSYPTRESLIGRLKDTLEWKLVPAKRLVSQCPRLYGSLMVSNTKRRADLAARIYQRLLTFD